MTVVWKQQFGAQIGGIQLNEFLKTKHIHIISTQAKKLKLPPPRSIHGAASGHWQPPDFPELYVLLICI